MKVFFRTDRAVYRDETLTKSQLQIEELNLPDFLERELLEQLLVSHQHIPEVVNTFQDWKVALLNRFTKEDLQL